MEYSFIRRVLSLQIVDEILANRCNVNRAVHCILWSIQVKVKNIIKKGREIGRSLLHHDPSGYDIIPSGASL